MKKTVIRSIVKEIISVVIAIAEILLKFLNFTAKLLLPELQLKKKVMKV